jgi:hypothetical protein
MWDEILASCVSVPSHFVIMGLLLQPFFGSILVAIAALLLLLVETGTGGGWCESDGSKTASPSSSSRPAVAHLSPITPCHGVGALVTHELYDELYPNRNKSFYTYESFLDAARSFPTFGTQGSYKTRLREIAAFSAHVQLETSGRYSSDFSNHNLPWILG